MSLAYRRAGAAAVRARPRPLGAALAALGFLACWGAVHYWFYRTDLIGDVGIYRGYGLAMRHGALPYRDFAFEYPPGALPVVLLPAYLGGYAHAFGIEAAVLGAALAALVALRSMRGAAFVAASPLLVGSLVLNRFDLWPTLLAAAAVVALLSDRHRLGWAAIGAGFAAKLFPVVLVPLAAVWTLRRRGGRELARSALAGAAVAVAAFAPFAVLAPHGLWASTWGQLSRPMQVESLGASLLILTHHAGIASGHGTQEVTGVLVAPLTALFGIAQALALVALWVGFARGPLERERLARYAAACVCAFVAFNKVLSPQYLIWLVPLVALVAGPRGRRAILLLAAAAVTTQVWYPHRYWPYVYHAHLAWVVVLRNLSLVALLGALALPLRFTSTRRVEIRSP